MSKSWYDEIKDYDFIKGQSKGGVIDHFTLLIWKVSKEDGFGIEMDNVNVNTVANYYPSGIFNNLYF